MWSKILKSHGLSKDQQQIIARFESDPNDKVFLPMAQLLVSLDYKDQAIEIMMAGVALYPNFTVARVLLVSYLWQKGLFGIAWDLIDNYNISNYDGNVLAWALIFKLSLVLEFDDHTRVALANLQSEIDLDQDLKDLIKVYTFSGKVSAKSEILAKFSSKVIKDLDYTIKRRKLIDTEDIKDEFFNQQALADENVKKSFLEDDNEANIYNTHDRFYTVPLNQVFSNAASGDVDMKDSSASVTGFELDSLTLAEIFERQHCYKLALQVYNRLMAASPANEGLQKKIAYLEEKVKAEQSHSSEHTDEILNKLDDKKIIDQKRIFYQTMLENLEKRKYQKLQLDNQKQIDNQKQKNLSKIKKTSNDSGFDSHVIKTSSNSKNQSSLFNQT